MKEGRFGRGQRHTNSPEWDSRNYDNIVTGEIELIKSWTSESFVKALCALLNSWAVQADVRCKIFHPEYNLGSLHNFTFDFNKAALSSRSEQVRKALRHKQNGKMTQSSYHVVIDLGFAVDDSLLGTYQTV